MPVNAPFSNARPSGRFGTMLQVSTEPFDTTGIQPRLPSPYHLDIQSINNIGCRFVNYQIKHSFIMSKLVCGTSWHRMSIPAFTFGRPDISPVDELNNKPDGNDGSM